jgi:iron complex outermembrane receptor protein
LKKKPQTPRGLFVRRAVPACIVMLLASVAQAQDASDAKVDEVLVTAQKRSQRLQDVPIAISTLSGSQLENRNIGSIADLGSVSPNLTVSSTPGNATASQIAIRGGVTINPALYWDTSVGMYVDGVYMGKSQGSIFKMVDLERVEVLRGPQGTLYGRNSMSGAINFITRKPSGEFGGDASVSLGSYNERVLKAAVDLPKFGIASVSLGMRSEDRDGWVKTTPGSSVSELNGTNQQQARLAVNLDISSALQADYRFDASKVNANSMHSQLYRADIPDLAPYVFKTRQTLASVDGPEQEKAKVQGHSLTLDWKLDSNNSLKSISSMRTMKWDNGMDLDGSPLPIAHTERKSDYTQWSQELQWVGSSGAWNYVLGAYLFKDDGTTKNPQKYFGGTFNADSNYGFTTNSRAVFGQLDYKLTDRWTLTGGLRSTRETKTIDRDIAFSFAPNAPYTTLIPVGTRGEATFKATSPLMVAAFKVNDDMNLYAKYAEGFKSGGFNGEHGDLGSSTAANIAEVQTPFRPEKQKTYELGLKSKFAGGRGQFNAAVFENKIDDLQLSIFTATGAAASVIRNAGKATTRGFELEATYAPSSALRLQASYGYLNAKYNEFMDAGVNVAANRAYVRAPKNSFALGLDWLVAQTGWGPLRLQGDYTFTDAFYTYPFQLASSGADYNSAAQVAGNTRVKSTGMLNSRLILSDVKTNSGKVQLSVWGRNLTNTNHIDNFIDFGPGFGNLTQAYFNQPRMLGVSAAYKW